MDVNFSISVPDIGTRRRRRLKDTVLPPGWPATIEPTSPTVSSVSPTTLSPVLKSTLTFSLSDYSDTMLVDDMEVILWQESTNYLRPLNVISVDDSAKTLTV